MSSLADLSARLDTFESTLKSLQDQEAAEAAAPPVVPAGQMLVDQAEFDALVSRLSDLETQLGALVTPADMGAASPSAQNPAHADVVVNPPEVPVA